MNNIKRALTAAAMICLLMFGAFAQDRGKQKPPPKESPPKVVTSEKKTPPANDQGDKKREDKRGKP